MPTRNISLTDGLDTFVADTLKSGRYSNASEVVREGLRLLAQHEEIQALKLQAFKAEVEASMADIEAGRCISFDSSDELRDGLAALRGEAHEMA